METHDESALAQTTQHVCRMSQSYQAVCGFVPRQKSASTKQHVLLPPPSILPGARRWLKPRDMKSAGLGYGVCHASGRPRLCAGSAKLVSLVVDFVFCFEHETLTAFPA